MFKMSRKGHQDSIVIVFNPVLSFNEQMKQNNMLKINCIESNQRQIFEDGSGFNPQGLEMVTLMDVANFTS